MSESPTLSQTFRIKNFSAKHFFSKPNDILNNLMTASGYIVMLAKKKLLNFFTY